MTTLDIPTITVTSNSPDITQQTLSKKSSYSSCSDIFFVSLLDRKLPADVSNNICPRCSQIVYPFEKIGPIMGQTYHKVCFKCIVCGRQLDLKSYYTNSVDFNDKTLYCQSHFPKSTRGYVNADNFHIRNIMQAPKPSVIQQLNLPRPTVDGRSVGILHAVNAQNLLHCDKLNQRDHHFPVLPPELVNARKQIYEVQKNIELKLKEEEDALYKKFFEERKREEERIEEELDNEWKMNLKELCEKYENFGRTNQNIPQALRKQFQNEKKHLEVDLTLKRVQKRRSIKQYLFEQERNETTELVTRQSKEMLQFMEKKRLEIMNTQGIKVLPKQAVSPHPLKRRKSELYSHVSDLDYIDKCAIEIALTEQNSYTELVEKLTEHFESDLEKARAIFRWITVKDLNQMEFHANLTDDSPMCILRGIKFGTETYHTLFMRLCSYAGLHCVNVKGHSKSFGYEPGLSIKSGQFLNTWNAVLIDDEWRFVQCNWGSRHLVMCKDAVQLLKPNNISNSDKIEYEYDEHYFLTDPEEFIFEFFPFDSAWQLLSIPLTLSEFERLPFVRSLFFHYSLSFINQKEAVIKTDERGACDIQIRMPSHMKNNLVFHSQLRIVKNAENSDASESDKIGQLKLENFVLHTVENDIVSFNIHLPKRNNYHLELFASTIKNSVSMFGQTFKLRCVCKYKLECNVLKQRMHALPECANGEWGPEKAIRHYGWKVISHKCAIIETIFEDIYIIFQLTKKLKIHCKLNCGDEKAVKNQVQVSIDCHFRLTIQVYLHTNAQYGLDIYAFDPDEKNGKKIMSHCCKYLINRSNSFPHVLIGENVEAINNFGNRTFVPISHKNPYVDLYNDQMEVELSFIVTPSFSIDFCLKFDGDTDLYGLPLNEYLIVDRIKNNVVVKVHLPLFGRFLLTIFINKNKSENPSVPIFGYAIRRSIKK